MKGHRCILFLLMMRMALPAVGQTKFKAEIYTYAGREHNIFKSPDILFDLQANEYYGDDSLQVSAFFIDAGLDLRYQKNKAGKYNFGVNSDLWKRMYFAHSEANQSKLSGDIYYERIIGENLLLGAAYDFSVNDRIGTSITGDELLRSFKYLGNYGDLYLIFSPGEKLEVAATGSFVYKNYYADSTETPLDHTNLTTELTTIYQVNRKHGFELDLSFTNRNYLLNPASDRLGKISQNNPLRNYRYYDVNAAYDFRPVRGALVSPKLGATRRRDLYQDYYSYFSYDMGISLRYMKKKIYVYLSTSYRHVDYEQRYAFTLIDSSQLLRYKYLRYNFKMKYKLLPALELFLNLSSDNRESNTELEYARTRRPYTNYEMLVGFTVIPFDYSSK